MGVNLEPVVFDPERFQKELSGLHRFLKSKPDLSEMTDIQPFFKKSKHLAAYMGTIFPEIGPATEITFDYPFFGDFKADLLLGSKSAKKFCVVEFEDGFPDSIFKQQPKRGNPEWMHGSSTGSASSLIGFTISMTSKERKDLQRLSVTDTSSSLAF